MLQAIPDPEKTATEADIESQRRAALISTIGMVDPSSDAPFASTEVAEGVRANYIPLSGHISDIMECQYLDADDDADAGGF